MNIEEIQEKLGNNFFTLNPGKYLLLNEEDNGLCSIPLDQILEIETVSTEDDDEFDETIITTIKGEEYKPLDGCFYVEIK